MINNISKSEGVLDCRSWEEVWGAGGWEGLQVLSKLVKEGLVEVTFEHRCLD